MAKKILSNQDARDALMKGVNQLADAVKTTMGPGGRTVIIEKSYGAPTTTKDGVSVAKEVSLPDPVENIGARMVREAASKTADIAGDGTTTATILAQKMLSRGFEVVKRGMNPMNIKRGIDAAVAAVVADIEQHSRPVKDNSEIAQIATISANGDTDIGAKIADAMEKVGKEGVISVEEAKGLETEVSIAEGMQFDRGFLSTYFVTNADKMLCEMDNAQILISEQKISTLQSLLPILEPVAQSGRSLLIIADDIDSEALATLVLNRLRGGLKVCAVKAPGFGDRRKEMLKDIAIMTGATLISGDLGMKIENITPAVLGGAKRVIVGKDNTLIVDGAGDSNAVAARANEIRNSIETSASDYDKEKLAERLARLVGGVAVIKVGGMTEVEVKEKKDRVDDALAATRAAVSDGIVPGGGVALLRGGAVLAQMKNDNVEMDTAIDIVLQALSEPAFQIAENAGLSGAEIVEKIKAEKDYNIGYDAANHKYVDMVDSGVIDPAKVVKTALRSAASVVGTMLTAGAILSEIPEEKPAAAAPQMPMM